MHRSRADNVTKIFFGRNRLSGGKWGAKKCTRPQGFFCQQYILNPVRCFKCQWFGHTIKFCKNTQICAKCGESHTEEQCSNPLKCINCRGSHTAFNKECPKWVSEKKVQQIWAEKGVLFPRSSQTRHYQCTFSTGKIMCCN